jgi:hypothetical protein
MNKRCLLIIPKHFYSFQKIIKSNLESLGYDVTVANDEYPENTLGLLIGKLRIPIRKKITEQRLRKDYLQRKHYDVALIFKGRGINLSTIRKLKEVCPRIIGYNWDSFTFNPSPLAWYRHVAKYCTFDYKDADTYQLPLVELFTTESPGDVKKEITYKFSAIFRNHSHRLRYLHRLIKQFEIQKKDIFIYIFEKNIFFTILNFFTSPVLYLKYLGTMHFTALENSRYIDILRRSCYTLDYAHPKQTGLTMRCFDALSTNTKIITNNEYITHSPYFLTSKPIVFKLESTQTKHELDFSIDESQFHSRRTVIDFLRELLV